MGRIRTKLPEFPNKELIVTGCNLWQLRPEDVRIMLVSEEEVGRRILEDRRRSGYIASFKEQNIIKDILISLGMAKSSAEREINCSFKE